jgi:hypothetical protein
MRQPRYCTPIWRETQLRSFAQFSLRYSPSVVGESAILTGIANTPYVLIAGSEAVL